VGRISGKVLEREEYKFQGSKIYRGLITVLTKKLERYLYSPKNLEKLKTVCLTRVNLNLTEHLGYVLGVLFGDGCCWISREGKYYHYVIELQTIDKEFADEFSKECNFLGLHSNIRKCKKNSTKLGFVYRVRSKSKIFVKWFKSHKNSILNLIFYSNKKIKFSFLRGIFDSDGNFYFNSIKGTWVQIFTTNLKLARFYHKIIRSLGFYPTLKKIKSNYTEFIYCVRIGKREQVRQFLNLINPSIPRKKWEVIMLGSGLRK
jgi:intein-encoded DNA endonuclease-like protein